MIDYFSIHSSAASVSTSGGLNSYSAQLPGVNIKNSGVSSCTVKSRSCIAKHCS